MALSVGERLGPFEILASIGAGGMGEVYRARDIRLDRLVAIKQLHAQHATRFEQEARAIAAVNHPHICQIYDIGTDYLVLEYIQGAPLRGPLPPSDAVQVGIQIASALEAAHSRGILHRDLKPGNVIVTDSGVKLLDFGIAKLFDSDPDATRTVPGTVSGTPAYMSPEQAHGRSVDARSEIFSFGALLYEMLSGDQAFAGNSVLDVLNAIVQTDPPPVQVPEDLTRIVARCLRKVPSERFQTMTELKIALEQCLRLPAPRKPSIAVLPFANLSAEKDEYFSDGLAEEIINLLARIPELKVIARTSAFAFRGKEEDIRKIAGALNVRTILEGSVRRAGNRIRVTAQLISAEDSSHLWSGRYDREMADVFALQDEIALAIAGALQITLTGAPCQTGEYRPDLSAYDALLKARYHLRKLTPEAIARAQESLKEAASLDPGYALPYCELAQYYSSLALFEMQPAREAMPLARAAAKQALAIDPATPEALAIMAWIQQLTIMNGVMQSGCLG